MNDGTEYWYKTNVSSLAQPPTKYHSFSAWPVPDTQDTTLWLSHKSQLQSTKEAVSDGQVSYQSDVFAEQVDNDPGYIEFEYTFSEPQTLIGPSRAILFMSCPDHNDMDIFVIIRKADKSGKILRNVNIPLAELGLKTEDEVENLNTLKYIGPSGILRASHRAIDEKLSKPHWPAHDHTREDKIPPGLVVEVEIGIWPAAIQFEAGEKLIFRVAGHQMTLAEFPPLRGGFQAANKGTHILHYGGQYGSRLILPFVQL